MPLSEPRGRRVVIVGFPGAQTLDITGPLEVFSAATRLLRFERGTTKDAYRTHLAATHAGDLQMSSGLRIVPDSHVRAVRGPVDTLVVAGGEGVAEAAADATLLRWLRRVAPRTRRVASVCTGAFILAQAGLLDGRRATTHWASCDALARTHPSVDVDRDAIFVRDGNVYTSAGVTAGMDLALALVEADHGRELALAVARWLVLFLKRPGGQSQFSAQLAAQCAARDPIREVQGWIVEHPADDLTVDALAARASMSPRHFARVFVREAGTTPGRFVERARIEAARRRLEDSADGVEQVAAACGFGTAESMRRAFVQVLRVSPSAYRSRFRSAARA